MRSACTCEAFRSGRRPHSRVKTHLEVLLLLQLDMVVLLALPLLVVLLSVPLQFLSRSAKAKYIPRFIRVALSYHAVRKCNNGLRNNMYPNGPCVSGQRGCCFLYLNMH